MAIIGRIRQYSGLTVIFVGVALAAFVLGDLGKRNFRSKSDTTVGKIAGVEISYEDFNRAVSYQQHLIKLNNPQINFTSEDLFSIQEQAWNHLVDSIIYYEQFEKLGLTISKKEVDDMIYGENPHPGIVSSFTDPETGEYEQNRNQFFSTLDQHNPEDRIRLTAFLTGIKDEALKAKYKTLLNQSYYAPTAFAEMRYNFANEKRDIEIVQIPYMAIPDSIVTLTDDDYQKYYDEHKESYKREETRKIEYVIFDIRPSSTDISNAENKIGEVYNKLAALQPNEVPRFVNEHTHGASYDSLWKTQRALPPQIAEVMFFNAPGTTVPPYRDGDFYYTTRLMEEAMRSDTLEAEHILITFKGIPGAPADSPTKERAQFLADSLANALKKPNAMPFALCALQFSKDPYLSQNAGNLGRFADGAKNYPFMVYAFNEAIQNGKTGDIITVETPFGIHVIKISDKNPPQKMVRIATIEQILLPSKSTIDNIYAQASKFATENRNIEAFHATAEANNYNIREMDNLQAMGNNLSGVHQARQVIRWAFGKDNKNNQVQVNDVSGVIGNVTENQLVVAALAAINPKGYATMESQKNAMQYQIMREKKGDMTLEKLDENVGTDLETIKTKYEGTMSETPVQITFSSSGLPGFGREPLVIGSAFGIKEGAFYGPVKGMNGVYFIKETGRTPAEPKEDYTEERTQMQNEFAARTRNSLAIYQNILRENAKIKDNRHLFY